MKIKDGFSGERSLVLPRQVVAMMENDPLASVLHITDMGYYPCAEFHFRERTTPIDQFVFIYCVDGRGWYEHSGRHYDVEKNQYFILPAGVPHRYGASEATPWTIYWIHFRGPLATHYANDAAEPQSVNTSVDSRISQRHNLFEEILSTLNASFAIENIRYAMAAFHHYLASLRYLKQYRASGSGSSRDTVEIIIHYLNENIGRKIRLDELAEYIGCSASHMSELFRQRTGHSILNYFNLLKVKLACQLLDTTDMKLNQISFKVGIDDPLYFSRLFSKAMGMSPRAYRTLAKA